MLTHLGDLSDKLHLEIFTPDMPMFMCKATVIICMALARQVTLGSHRLDLLTQYFLGCHIKSTECSLVASSRVASFLLTLLG